MRDSRIAGILFVVTLLGFCLGCIDRNILVPVDKGLFYGDKLLPWSDVPKKAPGLTPALLQEYLGSPDEIVKESRYTKYVYRVNAWSMEKTGTGPNLFGMAEFEYPKRMVIEITYRFEANKFFRGRSIEEIELDEK